MPQEKNYFETLAEVQCSTEKRKSGGSELTYVSWADAWADLKKRYPFAEYTIYENAEGFPFWASKYGIDVKVGVKIEGLEHIVRLPVMDGNNNAMKEEAYEYETNYGKKSVAAADTFDINKAIQRCFAKACAMHGLGLYVYRGEDLPDGVEKVVTNVAPKAAAAAKPAYKPYTVKAEYTGTHTCTKCQQEVVGPDVFDGKYGKCFKYPHCSQFSKPNPKNDAAKEAASIFQDPKGVPTKEDVESVPF